MRPTIALLIGVLLGTVCGFALAGPVDAPLTDRQAVITVEEDGSYPAGCVTGAYCDDTVEGS